MMSPAQYREIRRRLSDCFGSRLEQVIIYGSEARGEAQPDSDIDVLAVMAGSPSQSDDPRALDALYPMMLAYGRPIHVMCIDKNTYEAGEWPLWQSIKAQGRRI
jgi:uncharacterized protein